MSALIRINGRDQQIVKLEREAESGLVRVEVTSLEYERWLSKQLRRAALTCASAIAVWAKQRGSK